MSLIQWEKGKSYPKPDKGSHWKDGRDRRKAVESYEDAEKRKVRLRDKGCRWPHCDNCRTYKPRLEVAHVIAKGMGGDHGLKSSADQMMQLDRLTHQGGTGSVEQHGRRIEPLTPAGTDGPCAFYRVGEDGREYVVAIEIAVGGPYERD
jgi:hypothetical protein